MKSISSSHPIASTIEPDSSLACGTSKLSSESETQIITLQGETAPAETKSVQQRWGKEIEIFISTFFTIFLAELGDKTQITTLLMAAESHAPWIVFAGAGTALVATSLLGVLLGSWLSKRVSPRTLERSAGIMLLCISVLLVLDIVRS